MNVGDKLILSDNKHFAIVTKVLGNQNFIIECKDRDLTFTRLVDSLEIDDGLAFRNCESYLYRR